MSSSRRRTHGAKPSTAKRRRPTRAVPPRGPRRAFNTSCGIHFLLPRAGSCLAGLALALQRWHRRRRAASNVERRGGCWACIDEAFGRTTHEWRSACVVRLDPCSSSDVLTGTPSQSRGGRNLRPVRSRFPVLHTKCPGIVACKRSPFAPRTPCAGRTRKPTSRPASSSPRRAGARSASGGSDSRIR